MADTPPYKRTFSFAGAQANAPSSPLPGLQVDRELDDIADRLSKVAQSNYELAVLNGFTGTLGDYLLSLVGPPGPPGDAADIANLSLPVGPSPTPSAPYLSKIAYGQPPVLDMFSPYRNGVKGDEPLINAILDGHRACLIKPYKPGGTGPVYAENSPIVVPNDAKLVGIAGRQATPIIRFPGHTGDTIQLGTPTQSAISAEVEGVYCIQQGRLVGDTPTSYTLPNRLTAGQAHFRIFGGQGARITRCMASGMPYAVDQMGGYGTVIDNLWYYGGFWDRTNPALQESLAVVRLSYHPNFGYPGVPEINSPQWIGGNKSAETRQIPIDTKTFAAQERIGPAYGLLHASGERAQMRGGFLQGFNRYCVGVYSGGPEIINNVFAWVQIGLEIHGTALDESMYGAVGALRNDPALAVMQDMILNGVTMNGQLVSAHALDFSVGDKLLPSVASLKVIGCVGTAYQGGANRLFSVAGGRFDANEWRGYNTAGFDTTKGDPLDYCAGTMINYASQDILTTGDRFGGGANRLREANSTQWGLADATSGGNTFYGVTSTNLGLAGGQATLGGTHITP